MINFMIEKRLPLLMLLLLGVLGFVGCTESVKYTTGPPAGWSADTTNIKWWQSDLDTTGVFKKLDTFIEMGISQHKTVYGSPSVREMKELIVSNVQKRMISLYRSNPEVVDSLFTSIIADGIFAEDLPSDGNISAVVKRWTRNGYRRLSRHYREPRKKSKPAINPIYPDSLKYKGIGGLVHAQVSIDDDGNPASIISTFSNFN